MKDRRDQWPDHCRRCLVAAVLKAAALFPHPGEDVGERIHDCRKALKEARAIAKLFGPAIGAPAEEAIAALEAARRRIGRARDLDVMPAALASLGANIEKETADLLSRAIAAEREAVHQAHCNFDAAAQAERLHALAHSIEGWDVPGTVSNTQLLKALRGAYRTGRRRGRNALASGDAREIHKLRAQVVDVGHHFATLEAVWPSLFAAICAECRRMRQHLGEHNDLAVLARFAGSLPDLSPEQLAGLAALIEGRQKQLARRAGRQFERLFAERPSALEHRLSVYLEHPKAKAKPGR